MSEKKKDLKLETFKHSVWLLNKMLDAMLTMMEIFEGLALQKAKDEKTHLVVDDDIIAMTGMKMHVKRGGTVRIVPLDRARWESIKAFLQSARGIIRTIEPKKEGIRGG